MDIDYLAWNSTRGLEVEIRQTKVVDQRANIASELLTRWGMIAALPDGEDSAGRQQLRLMTPEELVHRACVVADLAWSTFAERGWLLSLPAPRSSPDKVRGETFHDA